MNNEYRIHLEAFFTTLLDYRHSTNRLNAILTEDAKIYSQEGATYRAGSSLIISDWSGPTDNGWEINFHTTIMKETSKENYAQEIRGIISRECCLIYSQSFEALEKYLKDSLFNKSTINIHLKEYISSMMRKNESLSRETMPGGEKLFKILKKTGGKAFAKQSKKNNLNIGYNELWIVLSEVRHSIVHSNSIIKFTKINRSKHHLGIFNMLFNYSKIDDDYIKIQLEYKKLEKLIKRLSEFGFQAYKALSLEENLEWNVYK